MRLFDDLVINNLVSYIYINLRSTRRTEINKLLD